MSRGIRTHFNEDLVIYIACRWNNEVKLMLNENLARESDEFGTLLHYAADWGNHVIARELIDLGADVDGLGFARRTPLMLAIQKNHTATVKVLLAANANIDFVDSRGQSALLMSVHQEYLEFDIFEAVVRKLQAECRTTDELARRLIVADGNMYHAATFRDVDLMKCMLEYGIDVKSTDYRLRTALHLAAELNDVNSAKWLISHGADVEEMDGSGNIPLIIAAEKGNTDAVRFLLQQGSDPNCEWRDDGYSPLFVAFERLERGEDERFVECIELLLQYGAIPRNPRGIEYTIFDFALDWSSDEGVKMLVGHLAMLELGGEAITESVMYCEDEVHQSRMPEFKNFYDMCLQVLKITVFGKLSLFNLLQAKEHETRLLVRRKTFTFELERFCFEYTLSELYRYYYRTLMKRTAKASRAVKLEDEAVPVMCKIFNCSYNQCYNFAREIVGYLNVSDLEQLIKV